MGEMRPFQRSQDKRSQGKHSPDQTSGDGAYANEPTEAELLSALIEQIKRGDEQAFSQFYDRMAGLVFGVCRKVIRDPAHSQEVTQEVFLELWRIAPRYDRSAGSVKSWVATIAHRRAVDRVRSEEKARAREEKVSRAAPVASDNIADEIFDRFERDFEQERVRRALGTLTELQREAIELAYYGGHTYREVAVLLESPEGTVKTRIRDGLTRLRDELGAAA